jgi:hypothetical protein
MVTTNDEKVGPGTFTRGSHSVTIAEDGKILVRKDDWLSKYSWALYGDYDTLDVFVRPNPKMTSPTAEIKGIKEIEDVDQIETGEYLIHVPTYFSWMEKRGVPVNRNRPKPKRPNKPGNRLVPDSVREFLWWLAATASPANDWEIKGSNGWDLNAVVFNGHGLAIDAQRKMDSEPTTYYGAGVGAGVSLAPCGASISPTIPGFPGKGVVHKFPIAGASLSADEFCGTYFSFEIGASLGVGGSVAGLLFGIHFPPEILIRKMAAFLGGSDVSWRPFPMGLIILGGTNIGTPDLGATLKVGVMHRRDCLPF